MNKDFWDKKVVTRFGLIWGWILLFSLGMAIATLTHSYWCLK